MQPGAPSTFTTRADSSSSGAGAASASGAGGARAGLAGRFSTATKKFQSVAKAIAVTSKGRPDGERESSGEPRPVTCYLFHSRRGKAKACFMPYHSQVVISTTSQHTLRRTCSRLYAEPQFRPSPDWLILPYSFICPPALSPPAAHNVSP